jgi:hypothetical protein
MNDVNISPVVMYSDVLFLGGNTVLFQMNSTSDERSGEADPSEQNERRESDTENIGKSLFSSLVMKK